MVTHCVTMLEKHLIFTGEVAPRNFTPNRVKKKTLKTEDPMSHRIIEKRRRDRMNNCLADLSRLIPADYLKKGRGRIEKTEIIEMAIKHMRHLQNIIAAGKLHAGEGAEQLGATPPTPPSPRPPIITEHYRLGYLECLSEAMHFLVEVQGFFAGDTLCVQMINHLHKHCDKILKGDTLNFPRQRNGETTSSNSSTSTNTGNYNSNNTSPPLGMSNSTGSNSDDNNHHQYFDGNPRYDPSSYDSATFRTSSDVSGCFRSSSESFRESSSVSESFRRYPSAFGYREPLPRFPEASDGFQDGGYEDQSRSTPRDYSTSSGIASHTDEPVKLEDLVVKEENLDGGSQLREMLSSPKNSPAPAVRPPSPTSHTSGCETLSSPDTLDHVDLHQNMYKFKNNIKQRFSKENRSSEKRTMSSSHDEELLPTKRARNDESYDKECDNLMKERLNLLDRHPTDLRCKETKRHAEQDVVSPRLSFGHKNNDRGKRWDENMQNTKLIAFRNAKLEPKFHKLSIADSGIGVPIFALHAKGSFYIPLTLDQNALLPFLAVLGVTKTDEPERKPVMHPVTISVNFESQFLSKDSKLLPVKFGGYQEKHEN